MRKPPDNTQTVTALDVGSGSGIMTALIYFVLKALFPFKRVQVVGVEHIAELAQQSRENLIAAGLGDLVKAGCLYIVHGDGSGDRPGTDLQPMNKITHFDVINCGASAVEVPESLKRRLKPHGRFVCPIGPRYAR